MGQVPTLFVDTLVSTVALLLLVAHQHKKFFCVLAPIFAVRDKSWTLLACLLSPSPYPELTLFSTAIPMKTKLRFIATIATMLTLGAIAPQATKAEILMPIMYAEGEWSLRVPDTDTTVSAYGGRLRLYDVHIAKLVEVTHYLCTPPRRAGTSPEENGSRIESYDWIYTANAHYRRWAEATFMGNFTITCELAQSLVETYGLGKPELTTINHEAMSAERTLTMGTTTIMIPILDIRGKEIGEWMNFTSSFKPRNRAR